MNTQVLTAGQRVRTMGGHLGTITKIHSGGTVEVEIARIQKPTLRVVGERTWYAA